MHVREPLFRLSLLLAGWLSPSLWAFPIQDAKPRSRNPNRIRVLAPQFIGDPSREDYRADLRSGSPVYNEAEWTSFRREVKALRRRGIREIRVNVWWGVVQQDGPDVYDWSYYSRLFNVLVEEGMKIEVTLATHKCGADQGDNPRVSVPSWVWSAIDARDPAAASFESEAGNRSVEALSLWSTPLALAYYRAFWSAFVGKFRDLVPSLAFIGISLGPAGELRFPAHGDQDSEFAENLYPKRGLFQGSSPQARHDYLEFLRSSFESIEALNQKFSTAYKDFGSVFFPRHLNPRDFTAKLGSAWLQSAEAETLFDWYHQSLVRHMETVMKGAAEIFWKDPDFKKIPLAIRIPRIHHDPYLLSEVMDGLVSVEKLNKPQEHFYGYEDFFEALARLNGHYPGGKFEVYTSTPAGSLAEGVFSKGEELIKSLTLLAGKSGIDFKVENLSYDGPQTSESTRENEITVLRFGATMDERGKKRCETPVKRRRNYSKRAL